MSTYPFDYSADDSSIATSITTLIWALKCLDIINNNMVQYNHIKLFTGLIDNSRHSVISPCLFLPLNSIVNITASHFCTSEITGKGTSVSG